MQSCNRNSISDFIVFFIVYWILCTSVWIFIDNHHSNSISSWLSSPVVFWGVALTLFTVLSLLLFFMRCRSGCKRYKTSFEQSETPTEAIEAIECERQGKRLDDLEIVNLNRPSEDYSFVEQAPPRYVNINDIMIDDRRNETMTPTLILMKPPVPVTRKLRQHEGETVMAENPDVTVIPITSIESAPSWTKTEIFLYVNDPSS